MGQNGRRTQDSWWFGRGKESSHRHGADSGCRRGNSVEWRWRHHARSKRHSVEGFQQKCRPNECVLAVISKDTDGFNLIDAKTGANDDSTGGTSKFTVDSDGAGVFSGSVTGSGQYQATSDKRFKKRITQLQDAMEKLKSLRGVHYYWRKGEAPHTNRHFDDSKQVGFIAQEVEDVIPEVVRTAPDGFKTMQYSGIIPYTVEALKLHDTTIAHSQATIAHLQAENAHLQAENAHLQREMGELRATVMAHSRILASSLNLQADGSPAQQRAAVGTDTQADENTE